MCNFSIQMLNFCLQLKRGGIMEGNLLLVVPRR